MYDKLDLGLDFSTVSPLCSFFAKGKYQDYESSGSRTLTGVHHEI